MQSAKATPEVRVRELRSNNERSEWRGANKKSQLISVGLFVGTSKRTRTADFAVRGRRLNRLTIEAC